MQFDHMELDIYTQIYLCKEKKTRYTEESPSFRIGAPSTDARHTFIWRREDKVSSCALLKVVPG